MHFKISAVGCHNARQIFYFSFIFLLMYVMINLIFISRKSLALEGFLLALTAKAWCCFPVDATPKTFEICLISCSLSYFLSALTKIRPSCRLTSTASNSFRFFRIRSTGSRVVQIDGEAINLHNSVMNYEIVEGKENERTEYFYCPFPILHNLVVQIDLFRADLHSFHSTVSAKLCKYLSNSPFGTT